MLAEGKASEPDSELTLTVVQKLISTHLLNSDQHITKKRTDLLPNSSFVTNDLLTIMYMSSLWAEWLFWFENPLCLCTLVISLFFTGPTADTWAEGYVAKLSLGLGSITGPASVLGRGTHPSPSAVTSATCERAQAPRWPLLPHTVYCGHRKGVRPDQYCVYLCRGMNRTHNKLHGAIEGNQINDKIIGNKENETLSTQTVRGASQTLGNQHQSPSVRLAFLVQGGIRTV